MKNSKVIAYIVLGSLVAGLAGWKICHSPKTSWITWVKIEGQDCSAYDSPLSRNGCALAIKTFRPMQRKAAGASSAEMLKPLIKRQAGKAQDNRNVTVFAPGSIVVLGGKLDPNNFRALVTPAASADAEPLGLTIGAAMQKQASIPGLPIAPILSVARELMDKGQIAAGRKLLMSPALAESQEGAWLLARSYDPNYHELIASPDMAAENDQAKKWYRRWRDISSSNGAPIDELRYKRIVDSIQ